MSTFEVKVGSFAIKRYGDNKETDCLCYIDAELASQRFSVLYVPNGGGSFAWGPEMFHPVVKPVDIAQCRIYAANIAIKELSSRLEEKRTELATWYAALEVLTESENAQSAISKLEKVAP